MRIVCAILCAAMLTAAAPSRFTAASAPYAFTFPRDHFSHDAYRTEWWYFTGHLQAPGKRRFGYELTFFRIGLEPRASAWSGGMSKWRAYQLYPAHFAISDVSEKRFVHYQTIARDALGEGFASESKLDVRAGSWRLSGPAGAKPRMHLSASQDGDALDLWAQSSKPPAIHGAGGISRKGSCSSCASHYYSFSRLATNGTLTRNGVRFRVAGISWMDHEFGSDELQADQSGWDWFSIQLGDGRDVMLYRLRRRNGGTTPQSSGSVIERDGSVTYVPLHSFSVVETGTWKSPH
ncbi:MAG: carotenoid 1,2-hydratase, partial [Candidatus Eremiobacteraeota bacterium]|nr:carotenoid 1,2-hydratase [Candidatus Eremiobacteraeota bacterium]